MTLWQGSEAKLVTAVTATVAMPFYLGFVHTAAPQLVLYTGLAGAAMATGEFVDTPTLKLGGFPVFLTVAAVWTAAIVVLGGTTYLIALIF